LHALGYLNWHDALRDEGDAYARRLAEAGARVVHRQEPGLVRGS
jgi:acetyl esterase